MVVVAARYAPDGKLTVAQGYERRGQVWSDLLLLDRPTLIARLKTGRRVATGQTMSVPGDFVVSDALVLSGADGKAVVRASHTSSKTDNLGVPAF